MAFANESSGGGPQRGPLLAGLETIDLNQTVRFTLYVRKVLPLDGFVYWIRADLTSPLPTENIVIDAPGALHYATTYHQDDDAAFGENHVVFTSEHEVQNLNVRSPGLMYIATFEGIRFGFSARGSFFRQAELFHYTGTAVLPMLDTQLIDCVEQLECLELVVSNSLPIWLGLSEPTPNLGFILPGSPVTLFPSFLSPANLQPPFGTVFIETMDGYAIPTFDRLSNQAQLTWDKVKVTLWGLTADQGQDFLAYVLAYSEITDCIGLKNVPYVVDEKVPQAELGVLAMKKTIEFHVNYYQTRARDIARQVIKSCVPTFNFPK